MAQHLEGRDRPKRLKLALSRYVDGTGPQPYDLLVKLLCEEYECLPETLDTADVGRLVKLNHVKATYSALKRLKDVNMDLSKLTAGEAEIVADVLELEFEAKNGRQE